MDVKGGVAGCSVVGAFPEIVSRQPVKPQQKLLSAFSQLCRRNCGLDLLLKIFRSGFAIVKSVTIMLCTVEFHINLRLGESLQSSVTMFLAVVNENRFHFATEEFTQA